ncbi:MAG: hypothetical protein ACI9MR_000556 [Myxococcota bacterium]|jgi:hypothetical protein
MRWTSHFPHHPSRDSARIVLALALVMALGLLGCPTSTDPDAPSGPTTSTKGGADADGYVILRAANAGPYGVTLFDPRTGERANRSWELGGVVVSPQGDLVAGATERTVEIMRVGALTLDPVQTISVPGDSVAAALAFNSTGDRLFGSSEETVFWTDLEGQRMTWCDNSQGTQALRPSPDGRHYFMACRTDGAGTAATGLYDDFELVLEGPRYFPAGALPDRVQFSPDGQWLVVRHPVTIEGSSELLHHRKISLIHVPSRTLMPIGLDGDPPAERRPLFAGSLLVHPTNRLPALTTGAYGDLGLTYDVDWLPQDHQYIDLEGTMRRGKLDVAFEVEFGSPNILGPVTFHRSSRWDHLGFSADAREMFSQIVQTELVTGSSTDPITGITTAVQSLEVAGSTIRRTSLDGNKAANHDFGSDISCGSAMLSVAAGTTRLRDQSSRLGGWPDHSSTAPALLRLSGGALACQTEEAWSVIAGDAFTLENFGDVWSPDRRWADMTNGENVLDLCFRNIGQRTVIEVVCPNGPFGAPRSPSIAEAWPSGGHVRPGLPATVTGVSRIAASPGDEVHVFGVRLGTTGTLTIGDYSVPATDISAWTPNHVTFQMSANAPESGRVLVDAGDGSDLGAVHFYLTRTELWQPPFDAPTVPDALAPGPVEIQLTPDPAAINGIGLGGPIATELPGGGQLLFPTLDGAIWYIAVAPDPAARWVYAQADHLVRVSPVTVSQEIVIEATQWTPFLLVSGFEPAFPPVFHRLGPWTFGITGTSGSVLSETFAGLEQAIEGSLTCTICENAFRLPAIASDGLGRAVGYRGGMLQEFGGWEDIPEGRTRIIWEPAVTPDLGGGAMGAVGVSPDALVVIVWDGTSSVAYVSSDGADFQPLATLGTDRGLTLHYAKAATGPGWFVVGQSTLTFLTLTGAVEPLPAPTTDVNAAAGQANGRIFYALSKSARQLVRLDARVATPVWETVTEHGLDGQVLDFTVATEWGRVYALAADGQVYVASSGSGFSPVSGNVRLPEQVVDLEGGIVAPIGVGNVGVLVPSPRGSTSRVWFARQIQ